MVGFLFHVVIWLFAALVVILAAGFVVLEALDKIESIDKRVPWLRELLDRRHALVAALLIAIVLLAGDGYELYVKEMPEISQLPPTPKIAFPAIPAPKITIINSRMSRLANSQSCPILSSGGAPQDQATRLAQINANLPKGDRDRLADALFEFSQIFDEANVAWGKANHLKGGESGPLMEDLEARRSKVPDIESAGAAFEKRFLEASNKWKYFDAQLSFMFGDDAPNRITALRGAIMEYANILNPVLSLKDVDDTRIRALMWPEDLRYDTTVRDFQLWRWDCLRRLEIMRKSLQ